MFTINKLRFILITLVQVVFCVNQNCTFGTGMAHYSEMSEIPTTSYYYCEIRNAHLLYESEPVNTITIDNQRKNSDVKQVTYVVSNKVKFIPNSLFVTFINMEYFCISNTEGIEVLKPHFLIGAIKLKVFYVYGNYLRTLEEDLFVEAFNLEHINLRDNKIQSIHLGSFNKLSKLEGLYLQGNQIKNLNSGTFYHLSKLKTLNLTKNGCINSLFKISITNQSLVSREIHKKCMYQELSLISLFDFLNSSMFLIETKTNSSIKKLQDELKFHKAQDNILQIQKNFQYNILIGLIFLVTIFFSILGVVALVIVMKGIKCIKNATRETNIKTGNEVKNDNLYDFVAQ